MKRLQSVLRGQAWWPSSQQRRWHVASPDRQMMSVGVAIGAEINKDNPVLILSLPSIGIATFSLLCVRRPLRWMKAWSPRRRRGDGRRERALSPQRWLCSGLELAVFPSVPSDHGGQRRRWQGRGHTLGGGLLSRPLFPMPSFSSPSCCPIPFACWLLCRREHGAMERISGLLWSFPRSSSPGALMSPRPRSCRHGWMAHTASPPADTNPVSPTLPVPQQKSLALWHTYRPPLSLWSCATNEVKLKFKVYLCWLEITLLFNDFSSSSFNVFDWFTLAWCD